MPARQVLEMPSRYGFHSTRPAPWEAGRVASTRSRSGSEAPEPSSTRLCAGRNRRGRRSATPVMARGERIRDRRPPVQGRTELQPHDTTVSDCGGKGRLGKIARVGSYAIRFVPKHPTQIRERSRKLPEGSSEAAAALIPCVKCTLLDGQCTGSLQASRMRRRPSFISKRLKFDGRGQGLAGRAGHG
jgi:hypothetical protein